MSTAVTAPFTLSEAKKKAAKPADRDPEGSPKKKEEKKARE